MAVRPQGVGVRPATIVPNAVRVKARRAISRSSSMKSVGEYGTCTIPARISMTAPCTVATEAPPRHLPNTRALRCTGATSISRMKPNSRSHTIEIAEKIAVKRTLMAITPGNMKVRKSRPLG